MTTGKITERDFFYCFDIRLKTFLYKEGFKHIMEAVHIVSDKRFHLYLRTGELTESIDKYHKIRDKKGKW